ncbi:hypothetical protein R3P38DRAFT_2551988, partial [Favolaschia claudopus]
KWVWRSVGKNAYKDHGRVETRTCVGALICGTCGRVTCPLTQTDSRRRQVSRGCTATTCRSSEPLQQQTCKARTYHFKITRNKVDYLVWEHQGNHDTHQRPPGGSLSQSELDEQVHRRQTASVHQLRTGDAGPGSKPLADISATLANPRSARYHVSQSQARLGIASQTSAKGGLAFFKSLSALRNKLTTTFIVDSSLNGPTYISFQTPFMEGLIKGAVEAWLSDFAEGPEAGRHGFVTDGDMTFFRHGPLLASCVFNGSFTKWAPVLYTWIDQQDTNHHRAHFRCLFRSVIKYAGNRFNRELLLNVMDFSGAQRAAHAEEYADAVISTMQPAFSMLDQAAKDVQRELLVQEAQRTQVGCELHFQRSAVRIKKNGALVPLESVDVFDAGIRRMLSKNTSPEDFTNTVNTLKKTFPRIVGWINWWLRPAIASMIFPARSVVDPDLAAQVPSTTNPIEHAHSLLHHATGIDMDMVQGAENIWLHVRELEKQYDAIKAGHFNAVPPRSYRRPRPVEWEPNDGRAPDTAAALGLTGPQGKAGDPSNSFTEVFDKAGKKRLLQSYPWLAPNSCFFDNGLELWFRVWLLWDDHARRTFIGILPTNSILATVFYHYERRREWIYGLARDNSLRAGLNELEMAQRVVKNAIFRKWKLYGKPTEYGCAKTWLTHAIADGETSEQVHLYFGRQHSLRFTCASGHTNVIKMGAPETFIAINHFDLLDLRETSNTVCTWSEYFEKTPPRVRGGNSGSTPVHQLISPLLCLNPICPHSHSTNLATIDPRTVIVETAWPAILHLSPDASGNPRLPNSYRLAFPAEGGTIEYTLVGAISYRGLHWTSRVRIDGHNYTYNDLNAGRLRQTNTSHEGDCLPDEPGFDTVLLMYHRTSVVGLVRLQLTMSWPNEADYTYRPLGDWTALSVTIRKLNLGPLNDLRLL